MNKHRSYVISRTEEYIENYLNVNDACNLNFLSDDSTMVVELKKIIVKETQNMTKCDIRNFLVIFLDYFFNKKIEHKKLPFEALQKIFNYILTYFSKCNANGNAFESLVKVISLTYHFYTSNFELDDGECFTEGGIMRIMPEDLQELYAKIIAPGN